MCLGCFERGAVALACAILAPCWDCCSAGGMPQPCASPPVMSVWAAGIQRCKVTTVKPGPGAANTSMSRLRMRKKRRVFCGKDAARAQVKTGMRRNAPLMEARTHCGVDVAHRVLGLVDEGHNVRSQLGSSLLAQLLAPQQRAFIVHDEEAFHALLPLDALDGLFDVSLEACRAGKQRADFACHDLASTSAPWCVL